MANKDVTATFKANTSELQAEFQKAQRAIKLANAEFNESTASLTNWKTSATGLEAKLKQLYTTRDAEKDQLKNLQSQYEKAVELLGENSVEAETLNIKIVEQQAKISKTNAQINRYRTSLEEMANATEETSEATEETNEDTKSFGETIKDVFENGISKLSDGLKSAGEEAKNTADGGFTVLKGVLVDLASNAIQSAIDKIKEFASASVETGKDFSSSMSQVAATMGITKESIDGVNPDYEQLEETARECGATTQFSATESADALNYLALAGYDTAKACEALPTVLNIAAAGGMDLASASDMVTDAMSALNIEATSDNLTDFGDKLAKTSQKSNTSVSQLGEAILTVGGTAQQLAGGTTELNTALGILANSGTKGSEGGTALRNVILSLGAPTDIATAKIKELGVKVYDAQGNIRPLNDIFKDLQESMKDMTQEEKNVNLSTIFNRADLADVQTLLANCGDAWDSLADAVENSDNACQDMASTMNDNLAGDMKTLNSAIEEVQIKLYEKLEPAMRDTIQGFTDLVGKIDWEGLFDKIFTFKDNIVNAVNTFITPAWDSLKNSVSSAVDKIKEKIPLIKEKVEEIVPIVVNKFNDLKDKFTAVKDTIVNLISTYILPVFDQLKESGVKIFDSLKNAIKGTDEPLVGLSDVFHNNIEPILNIIKNIVVELVDVVGNIITLLIDNKDSVIAILVGIGAGFLTWNVATMITGLATTISTLPAILTTVKTAMAGLNATISANPVGIITALVVGFIAYLVHLYNTSDEFRMLIDTIWQKVKDFFKEFAENWSIGVDMIVDFFTKTIPDTWQNFKNKVSDAIDLIAEWVTVKVPKFFTDCWQSIKDTFSNVGSWFEDTFTEAWEKVKEVFASWGEFFSGLWDDIKNTFSELGTNIGNAISGSVKAAINRVLEAIENTINGGIDLINGAISLINSIPGVNVGYVNGLSLPRLAKGGIVDSPTLAEIGEQGREAIIPLENNLDWLKTLANQLAVQMSQGTTFAHSTSSNVVNNFYQTNNSPKSLSRLEIYRQSKNLLSLKGA